MTKSENGMLSGNSRKEVGRNWRAHFSGKKIAGKVGEAGEAGRGRNGKKIGGIKMGRKGCRENEAWMWRGDFCVGES
jgi:hypothetical protein